jgi:hypothetical protein
MSDTKHTKRPWSNAERRTLLRTYADTMDLTKAANAVGRSYNSAKMQLWRLSVQFSRNPAGRVKRPATHDEAMALATAFEYHTDQSPELDLTTRRTTVDERQRLTNARILDQMSGTNYKLLQGPVMFPAGWTYTGWGPAQPPTNHGVYDEEEHPEVVPPSTNPGHRVFIDMAGRVHKARATSVRYLWGAIERTTGVWTNGNGWRATKYPWVLVTKWWIRWPWSMVVHESVEPGNLHVDGKPQTPKR